MNGQLFRLAVWLLCLACFPLSEPAHADLLSFCLAGRPASDATEQKIFDTQCPAYLQSQFSTTNASSAASAVTTQLAQQTSRAALYSSLEGLLKAPPSQVTSGVDVSALAVAAQARDADLTFQAAQNVGESLVNAKVLSADNQALVFTSQTALNSLVSLPIDAQTVISDLTTETTKVRGLYCGKNAPKVLPVVFAVAAGISLVSSAASAFQPAIVATAKTTSVSDASLLMTGGLVEGLGADKSFVRVRVPAVDLNNPVVKAYEGVRGEIDAATARLAACPTDPDIKQKNQVISDANAYVGSILQTSNGSPSILDIAAQRGALVQANINYTLVLQRDVSGGGVSAIKPNWFSSTKIIMSQADMITYQLVRISDGVVIAGNRSKLAVWTDTCGLDTWKDAFSSCQKH